MKDGKHRYAWSKEAHEKDWNAGVPLVSYCPCCGAEFISQKDQPKKGTHYTDCMWYEGDEPQDANPH